MDNLKLDNEELTLILFKTHLQKAQKAQLEGLLACNNPYTFSKIYCNCIKAFRKMEKEIDDNLKNNNIPPGLSFSLYNKMKVALNSIIKINLNEAQIIHEQKFRESFYLYITEDDKLKGVFRAMKDSWKN
ncbi:MAG: hypothetical protein WC662_00555 [Candidatus Paceibacterota bacterium]|jgi:hypothetical protein